MKRFTLARTFVNKFQSLAHPENSHAPVFAFLGETVATSELPDSNTFSIVITKSLQNVTAISLAFLRASA